MLVPIEYVSQNRPYVTLKNTTLDMGNTYVINPAGARCAPQRTGNQLLLDGCAIVILNGDVVKIYRVVALQNYRGALMRIMPSTSDEFIGIGEAIGPNAPVRNIHSGDVPKIPVDMDGASHFVTPHDIAASNIKRVAYPEHLRESYLKHHDNLRVYQLIDGDQSWTLGVPSPKVAKYTPYLWQNRTTGKYFAHYFIDDLDAFKVDVANDGSRVCVSDVDLAVDGSFDCGTCRIVINFVPLGTYGVTRTLNAWGSRDVFDHIKLTAFESQRRDIVEWDDLVRKHESDIYILDTYLNTSIDDRSSPIHFAF